MRASDLWEGSFVLKGTTPSLPSHLCQPLHHSRHCSPGMLSRFRGIKKSQKKSEQKKNSQKRQKKKTHTLISSSSTFSSTQVQAEFLVPDEAPRYRLVKPVRKAYSLHGPAHCRNERVRVQCTADAPRLHAMCKVEGGRNARGVLPQCRAAHGAHTLLRWVGAREKVCRSFDMKSC